MNIIQDRYLLKRTSKKYIDKILSENPDWNILDIGCGGNANKFATVVSDILDLSKIYSDKKFIKLDESHKKLPFKDKEFDFVIASHVIEHVNDVSYFLKELERISSKGYIEVPTKLEDNLVFENKKAHLWHIIFDDVINKMIISEKIQYFEPILSVGTTKHFNKYFRESMVIELYWENKIDFILDNKNPDILEKISLLKLFKKYFSKRIRMFFSK